MLGRKPRRAVVLWCGLALVTRIKQRLGTLFDLALPLAFRFIQSLWQSIGSLGSLALPSSRRSRSFRPFLLLNIVAVQFRASLSSIHED